MNIILIVDTETTGLNRDFDELLEIAAIRVDLDTNEIVDTFSSLIRPENPIPAEATEINGITDDMVKDAPACKKVMAKFFRYAGADPMYAYNAGFDSKFINVWSDEHIRFHDILPMARRLLPEAKSHKLVNVVKHFHPAWQQSHRALDDCYFALEVIRQARKAGVFESTAGISAEAFAKTVEVNAAGQFVGKTIVFTGEMERMSRKEMIVHAKSRGFESMGSITTKTDYLVEGTQTATTIQDGISSKKRKALDLMEKGSAIQILSEAQYLEMVGL